MSELSIFNVILGLFMLLAGFLLNTLWNAVKDLQAADKALAEKVSQIDVLVAGDYVKRVDMERVIASLFLKLDRIEDKLDHKVDKQHGS